MYDWNMMTSSDDTKRPISFKPEEISALVNNPVIEQHAEEAAFLWVLRENAIQAHNCKLQDLADLDERVEAHIDGLKIAGIPGWKYCLAGLEMEDPGEVFTAGVIALDSGDADQIKTVLDIACTTPELERALSSALGWLPFKKVRMHLDFLIQSEDIQIVRIGLAGFAIHRQDPGNFLIDAAKNLDSRLRSRALKAIGELGKPDFSGLLTNALSDTDKSCRYSAAWSAARLGLQNDNLINALSEIATGDGNYCGQASDMIVRALDFESAGNWCKDMLNNPGTVRCAIIGIGALGKVGLINDLILLMENEEVTRLAGAAFSMITGADIENDDLDEDEAEEIEGESSDDFEDDDDMDENLPLPSAEKVKKWWQDHRKDFQPGVRYLRGSIMNMQSLKDTLILGNQVQRAAAAIEIAIREPGKPMFEVRAPGKIQLNSLRK